MPDKQRPSEDKLAKIISIETNNNMAENQTSAFFGRPYSWSKVKFELNDVQPLHGGIKIYLHSWTSGPAYITRVAPGGKETKYRFSLGWNEKELLCQMCIDQDFLTIDPENRPGIPDEARPSITMTNHAGKKHTVAKWAGVKDARFDAIYEALRQIGERTKGIKPIPERLRPYQKVLFWLGLALMILAALLLVNRAANVIVTSWWPERSGRLAGLTLVLIVGLIPALLGLRFWERHKPRYDRMSANLVFLTLLNLLLFVGLVTLPTFLWRSAINLWGETVVTQGDGIPIAYLPILPRFSLPADKLAEGDYATLLLTTIFASYLLIFIERLARKPILAFVDERF